MWKFFQFSRKERAGIILLCLLIILTHYLPDWMVSSRLPVPDTALKQAVDEFHRQMIADTVHTFARRNYHAPSSKYKQAYDTPHYYHKKVAPLLIDINTADTLEWQRLRGIGPGFARRIVKFRDALGGFYEVGQVSECYGLPDSTFQKIQPFLKIGDSSLKILDLNLTDEKSLAAHPYIRYKLARLIVQYRSMHAGFSRVSDLRNLPLVDDVIYRKIEHYIMVKP
jgi:DNA uptake protein ComE-like DNA-binding protein